MKKMVLFLTWVITAMILLSSCQKRQLDSYDKTSTTCGNITMDMGSFSSRDGYIYFRSLDGINEYDTLNGKTVFFSMDISSGPAHLNVLQDHIYYTDFSGTKLYRCNREGKEQELIMDECMRLFIDGGICFYMGFNGAGYDFYRSDLTFKAPELIAEGVFTYYVDETDIYIIIQEDQTTFSLYKSSKDAIQFEKIKLSFSPICVYTYENDIYLATTMLKEKPFSYQIVRYSNGKEIPLPIFSLNYQILDGHLIYLDDLTSSGGYTLKAYDLSTGEIENIFEDVMHFGILEDRYICAWCMGNEYVSSSSWMLYDWQTGETKQMYP